MELSRSLRCTREAHFVWKTPVLPVYYCDVCMARPCDQLYLLFDKFTRLDLLFMQLHLLAPTPVSGSVSKWVIHSFGFGDSLHCLTFIWPSSAVEGLHSLICGLHNKHTSPNCLNSPPIIWTSLTFAKYKDCFNFSRPFPDSIDWHIAVSSLWYWVVINTQLQIAKNSDNLVSWPSPPSSASPCQSRLISFNFHEMIKMRERWMERSESWEYCTTCITKAPGHPP